MTFMMMSSNDDKSDIYHFFFFKTYSILSIQYMYQFSCRMNKKVLRYSILFHLGPTRLPPALRFSKSPAQVLVLLKGITKPCTHFHPALSTTTQLISTSIQLHPPPPSSFQPPPSSLQHPQRYQNQNIALNWAISPNLG